MKKVTQEECNRLIAQGCGSVSFYEVQGNGDMLVFVNEGIFFFTKEEVGNEEYNKLLKKQNEEEELYIRNMAP